MNYLLVHGACHDAWCWHRIESGLAERGHEATAIDLPLDGFESDVAATIAAIESIDGPVVVAGHSYGGAVITAAAHDRADVKHLVYVAALVPDGTPEFSNVMGEMNAAVAGFREKLDDGRFLFNQRSGDFLYNTCSPEDVAAALARLRPMVMDSGPVDPMPASFRSIDSTYVLCRQDQAIREHLQRTMAKNTANVVEIDCDHSPFLCATAELLDALTARSIVD